MKQKGSSTLEILIAMAILTITLSAVILVSFSSQSLIVDSQNSNDALVKAQEFLEQAKNSAKVNFDLVENKTEIDGIFTKILSVTELDAITKKISVEATWNDGQKKADLYNIVVNLSNGPAANTCSFVLSGNWNSPVVNTLSLASLWPAELPADSNGIYTITDLDAYLGKLYITANSANSTDVVNKQKTFFVLNLANPTIPTFVSSIDDNTSSSFGLNAVHVGQKYAYTTSAKSSGPQLQIFDITLTPPKLIKNFQISSTSKGTSIFYKNDSVYLGLSKNISGPEFYIVNVGDVNNPVISGSIEIGSDVNDIYVQKDFAYIASGNNENVKILNISDPTNIVQAGSFISEFLPNQNSNLASRIFVLNDNIYLGRTTGTNEFYVLDKSNLNSVNELGKIDLIGSNDISGIAIRGNYAFISTSTGQLRIFDMTDLSNINEIPSSPINIGNPATSLDCEGNNIYIASNDTSGKGYVTVITANQ